MVQSQNERADFLVATAAVDLNQILDGDGKFVFAGVVRLKLFIQHLVGKLAGFTFIEDGELRVKAELVKMFAYEAQAEAVKRADVGDVEKRQLTRPVVIAGRGGGFGFEFAPEALAQFGGGGLGERNDEEFVERRAFTVKAVEATGDECFGFAGAGTGHDEDIAARFNHLPLGWC